MKLTNTILSLALAGTMVQAAERPIEVQWNDLCRVARGNEITVRTPAGEDIRGYCVSISVDEMSVRTVKGTVVKLARSTMDRIRMRRAKSGQLKALGRSMGPMLAGGAGLTFSPAAPAGLVVVPVTLAWGAIAAPFCILGDLGSLLAGTREIKPI